MPELKPGWRRVKFGEVVRLSKERCDPHTDGIERYIGLEHIEPGDLRVRSWGEVSDGTTFTTRVRPGQVLFGKRRAYQRKVAVADFDAVCSGDIYVFESANPAKLLPELLPFLCQTDAFFEYAVGTSAGSLSPRTNWTSLAEYEFVLPPLEEQRRTVAALRARQDVYEAYEDALMGATRVQSSLLRHFYGHRMEQPLATFCRSLITYGIVQAGPHIPDGVPYIRVSDMSSGSIDTTSLLRTAPAIAQKYKRSEVEDGDLVFALRGPIGLSVTVPAALRGANLTQGTARISVRRDWSTDYVRWALQSPSVQRRINALAKGSTFKEISLAALRDLPIPWASPPQQRATAETLNSIDAALRELNERKRCAFADLKHMLATALQE